MDYMGYGFVVVTQHALHTYSIDARYDRYAHCTVSRWHHAAQSKQYQMESISISDVSLSMFFDGFSFALLKMGEWEKKNATNKMLSYVKWDSIHRESGNGGLWSADTDTNTNTRTNPTIWYSTNGFLMSTNNHEKKMGK